MHMALKEVICCILVTRILPQDAFVPGMKHWALDTQLGADVCEHILQPRSHLVPLIDALQKRLQLVIALLYTHNTTCETFGS